MEDEVRSFSVSEDLRGLVAVSFAINLLKKNKLANHLHTYLTTSVIEKNEITY